MRGSCPRFTIQCFVAILCVVGFLATSIGTASRSFAAETWETWPKKTVEPGDSTQETAPEGAGKAGDAAGQNAAKGLSSGTIGWIAAGTAAVIGIAIAAGGGGSTSNH
jgi:hypothetical protein